MRIEILLSGRWQEYCICRRQDILNMKLIKMAYYFGTSVDYLLGLTDEKNHTQEAKTSKVKKKIKDWIMLHPVWMTVAVSVILFVIAFFFVWDCGWWTIFFMVIRISGCYSYSQIRESKHGFPFLEVILE